MDLGVACPVQTCAAEIARKKVAPKLTNKTRSPTNEEVIGAINYASWLRKEAEDCRFLRLWASARPRSMI